MSSRKPQVKLILMVSVKIHMHILHYNILIDDLQVTTTPSILVK